MPGPDLTPETMDRLLPALLDGLNDPDPLAARLAADALTVIGEPVVPHLLGFLERKRPGRAAAGRAQPG